MPTRDTLRCTLLALMCGAALYPTTYAAPVNSNPLASSKLVRPRLTNKEMQAMVAQVLRETSILRQLPIKRPVPSIVYTRAQVRKLYEDVVQNHSPSAEVSAAEIFIKQLGLAPANFNLKSSYLSLMGGGVAGAYDTQTKKFFTVDTIDPGELQMVVAHELTHALQDQHFDLTHLEDLPAHDSDVECAMDALVEGDATFTMQKFIANNPIRFLGMVLSNLNPNEDDNATALQSPQILRETINFPYSYGAKFVGKIYRHGGWKSVSGAFKDVPKSSEHILHYEKYLAHESPIHVPVRDVTSLLGKGWRLRDHDVNGEIGLFLVVSEHLKDDVMARRAAAGWGGDRYTIYEGPQNAALIVQDCVWDSDKDAMEWEQAYARATNNRFKCQPQQRKTRQVWNAAPYGVWMERRGRRVIVLEGTPGKFNASRVFPMIWRNLKKS